jgi:hypothetical protein
MHSYQELKMIGSKSLFSIVFGLFWFSTFDFSYTFSASVHIN